MTALSLPTKRNGSANPMVPIGAGHLGEIFMAQTVRLRSRRGAARALSAMCLSPKPLDPLSRLAYSVLRQAIVDAGHPKFCQFHNRTGFARAVENTARRNAAWDALLFLTDPDDEWLPYWCGIAHVRVDRIRRIFQPIRQKFEKSTGYGFDRPQWRQARVIPTAPNGAPDPISDRA